MRRWWLTIAPGPRWTRVVLMSDKGNFRLRARLPHGPRYPEALQRLIEALTLWCGGQIHVVLAVDGPGAFCATGRWLRAFEHVSRPQLYKIEFAKAPPDDRKGFGDIEWRLRARLPRK